MTPKCPKCSTELRDDYGMVTCPSCGAIVFVDMEGVAHVADDEGAESPMSMEPAPLEPLVPETPAVLETPMGTAAPEMFPLEPLAPEPLAPEPLDASAPETSEVDMNAFLGYAEPESAAVPMAESMSQNDPNDPLGISAYANSEISSAKDGPLVVTLIISGIDAKDLRDEIRQALQDSRFGWDAAVLMSSIKGGVLRIDRVSPVKATIVVNRLKHLSVRIRWEQNAITEIDPLEKEP